MDRRIALQIGGMAADRFGRPPLENATPFYKLHQSSCNQGADIPLRTALMIEYCTLGANPCESWAIALRGVWT
jgi:hypothetical protein